MSEFSEKDLTRFVRQRRNLFLATALLFFVQTTGASFEHVTVQGVLLVKFLHPERVIWWLWAAMGYFLWRYYQYFNVDIQPMEPMREYGQQLNSNLAEVVMSIFRERAKEKLQAMRMRYESLEIPYPDRQTRLHFSRTYHVPRFAYSVDNVGQNEKFDDTAVTVGWPIIFKQAIRAYASVAFSTPIFTEYHLPFLLPFFPITYELGKWLFK